ncbi:hypothetical protein [Paludisphaera sp.]|uniref:hypothetical protein n=1 Tax=Paludisphaera sp. TaxID=2017432 RepID=UPI00301E1C55
MKIRHLWLLTLPLAFGAPAARGALVYSLAAEQSNYSVNVGETVAVRIYLVEEATDGEASQLMGTDAGLISAGFRLAYGASDPSQVLAPTDIQNNPAFDSAFTLETGADPGEAWLLEDVDFGSSPAQGVERSPGVVALWLGTFTFTAQAAGTTVVAIEDFDTDPSFVNFTLASFEALDDVLQSGRFTINATAPGVIPEPSTIIMAATASLVLLPILRRRPPR